MESKFLTNAIVCSGIECLRDAPNTNGIYRERHMKKRENLIMMDGVRHRSIHDCARLSGQDRMYVKRQYERISA